MTLTKVLIAIFKTGIPFIAYVVSHITGSSLCSMPSLAARLLAVTVVRIC
jgi:hypothetical protein